jgi:hypothetical protein
VAAFMRKFEGEACATGGFVRPRLNSRRTLCALVTEERKSLTEIAAHLAIVRSPLQRWKDQAIAKLAAEVFLGHGRLTEQGTK